MPSQTDRLRWNKPLNNIDDLVLLIKEDILSVLRGSFSTTRRGLKLKKVKGKESWVFKYKFRIKRDREIF